MSNPFYVNMGELAFHAGRSAWRRCRSGLREPWLRDDAVRARPGTPLAEVVEHLSDYTSTELEDAVPSDGSDVCATRSAATDMERESGRVSTDAGTEHRARHVAAMMDPCVLSFLAPSTRGPLGLPGRDTALVCRAAARTWLANAVAARISRAPRAWARACLLVQDAAGLHLAYAPPLTLRGEVERFAAAATHAIFRPVRMRGTAQLSASVHNATCHMIVPIIGSGAAVVTPVRVRSSPDAALGTAGIACEVVQLQPTMPLVTRRGDLMLQGSITGSVTFARARDVLDADGRVCVAVATDEAIVAGRVPGLSVTLSECRGMRIPASTVACQATAAPAFLGRHLLAGTRRGVALYDMDTGRSVAGVLAEDVKLLDSFADGPRETCCAFTSAAGLCMWDTRAHAHTHTDGRGHANVLTMHGSVGITALHGSWPCIVTGDAGACTTLWDARSTRRPLWRCAHTHTRTHGHPQPCSVTALCMRAHLHTRACLVGFTCGCIDALTCEGTHVITRPRAAHGAVVHVCGRIGMDWEMLVLRQGCVEVWGAQSFRVAIDAAGP